jgi:Protein of unknown function (DUF3102)
MDALIPADDPMCYDYGQLDEETRRFAQQQAREIHTAVRIGARSLIAIGKRLNETKTRLPHGQFLPWVAAEFAWGEDTAENYMKMARAFPQIPNGSEFVQKALLLLSGRLVPEMARLEAQTLMASGQPLTVESAKTILATHLPDDAAAAIRDVPTADRAAVLSLASKASAASQTPLDADWITDAYEVFQEIKVTGDPKTVEALASAGGYVDDGNGGMTNALAAMTEIRAERIAQDQQVIREDIEKKQGLTHNTRHHGKGTILDTDSTTGTITIRAPELARDLGKGELIVYVIYEKGAANGV